MIEILQEEVIEELGLKKEWETLVKTTEKNRKMKAVDELIKRNEDKQEIVKKAINYVLKKKSKKISKLRLKMNKEITKDCEDIIEHKIVKKFGNGGCHIYVPFKYLNKKVIIGILKTNTKK